MKRFFLFLFFAIFCFPFFLPPLHASQKDLLRKIQKDSFQYFVKFTNDKTGLTPDSSLRGSPASSAASGFHILSYTIAAHNKWISQKEAYQKIRNTLSTLDTKVAHKNGFFCHFISHSTGKRVWNSEASSIDTALVIAGALVAGEYFKGTTVERLAQKIYDRVNWNWMLNNSPLLSHGYTPETGFIPYYWDTYSEHLILQALAIGAKKHAIHPSHWADWHRDAESVNGEKMIYSSSGSLFTYQYPHIFIDFKDLNDNGINYFKNSQLATLADRQYCASLKNESLTYQEGFWGLSACAGPHGYKAYGSLPGNGYQDGTIAPYAILSSLPFTPKESLEAISKLYYKYKHLGYGDYGFKSGINIEMNWASKEFIAIDQGATVAMIENYLSGFVWKQFMKLPATKRWIKSCGLDTIPSEKDYYSKPSRELIISPHKTP